MFATFLASGGGQITPDTLVLPGSQAIDDLEGEVAAYLGEALSLPYVGVVSSVSPVNGKVVVLKEFSGGMRGEFEVTLPAVLGIQSAEKPPRYVPVAKVRAKIETADIAPPESAKALVMERMYKPEVAGRAQMLDGSPEDITARITSLLAERGII